MRVLNKYEQINKNISRGVALGNFDGIHLGHQKLIKTLVEKSKLEDMESCVYTFLNHPQSLVKKQNFKMHITNFYNKVEILKSFNLDTLFFDTFSETIMSLSAEEFVIKILINTLNCKFVVVGFDYRFGYKAQGDVSLLKTYGEKYGFDVIVIEPVEINDEKVSSSIIRSHIKNGNITGANTYLGRPFLIKSHVINGKKRGRTMGYPTANIEVEPNQIIPTEGVYITVVTIDGVRYQGLTSIGTNPTFNNQYTSIETYIINYYEPLYDRTITIEFYEKIRKQIKFKNTSELSLQIDKDIKNAKKYLQDNKDMLDL
ncbi:bifunctional riboflavin kinase/FAD synthetase [Serpentinicella sp. ANB-PHB4]|uniref:bifunctional riboflavin kinase/FAD synthetase n=1 Tax=Serpentinicella sp. ANB-PHB4 TaxID=3074076 RepID=UPI00285C79A2|nr:bifunctional riboflavin kinase/FAD synthetase [Serpentinicella sp. ANB-PHB4]MDR5658216.1 bifunctional riboflavin kinase/FAD synthetase [Serpentinicella sp. ANB-PHB4]